ncbi:MAG TPA: LysM domain-containing protein, partial [Verrucomicrobiae bacterium]|nr:LysM domain-containing protein [Verrucomicrobiae bacterium]
YQAAFLAWEAAKLMPDNSDETARVLCTAGSWLKRRDPQTADSFYKALVQRCRKTAIGDQADRMRWFPALDENGNMIPWKKPEDKFPRAGTDAASGERPPPMPPPEGANARTAMDVGYEYTIHSGDSLVAITQACNEHNINVTALDILEANPGLDPTRLRVGQRILIPAPKSQTAPTATSQ